MDFLVYGIFFFMMIFSLTMVYKKYEDINKYIPMFFLAIVILSSGALMTLSFSVNDNFDFRMEDNLLEDHFYTHDEDGTVAAFHDYTQHTGSENYVFIHAPSPGNTLLGLLYTVIFLIAILFQIAMVINILGGKI